MTEIYIKGKKIAIDEEEVILDYLEIEDIHELKELKKLSGIKKLTLIGNTISSIDGLNQFENLDKLEHLSLAQNKIDKICGFEKLTTLKILNLAQNNIDKIENLDHLVNLEMLYLHENKISDIIGIKALKNLKTLRLDYNNISDISPVKKLKNLNILSLSHNKINNISVLKGLIYLKELSLAQNVIDSTKSLEKNTELLELALYSNELTELSGLRNLKKLEKLYVFNNKINSLSDIKELTSLKNLNISDNQINQIKGLDKLINLEELQLGMNQISTIEGLNNLKKLKILVLDSNKISEIQNLEELTNLKYLILSGNLISSIKGIPDLENLENLYLDHNNIVEVQKLDEFPKLKTLHLQNNKINNCNEFRNLSLNEFNLKENPIISGEELLKLPTRDLRCIISIDVERVIDINDSDVESLQKVLDFLLNPLEYFARSWGEGPTYRRELEKRDILEILNIFNFKMALEGDINKKSSIYRAGMHFIERRIALEEVESELYFLFRGLKELMLSTFSSSSALQKTHLDQSRKYLEKLRNKTYVESIELILVFFNLLESVSTGNFQDFKVLISQILNFIYNEQFKDSHYPIIRGSSVDIKFLSFIIHRLIAHIIRHLKSASIFSISKQMSNPFEDPKKKRFWDELKIEPIDVFEQIIGDLTEIRLYFAQMNLRKFFYNEMTGVILSERKSEITNQIVQNLNDAVREKSNLILFPEYCFPVDFLPYLKDFSERYNIWIVGGVERCHLEEYKIYLNENAAIIFPPGMKPIVQKKNYPGKDEPDLNPSKNIKIINSPFGIFAVLICADFLHDVVCLKIKEKVDFILVPAFNKDIQTFELRAMEKCLSNFSYIFIANIKKYGGYGIYAPLRGKRKLEIKEFPKVIVDLNEFKLHRERICFSNKYKTPISETLGN